MIEGIILGLDKRFQELVYRIGMAGNPIVSASQDPERILVALRLPDYGIITQPLFYRLKIDLRDYDRIHTAVSYGIGKLGGLYVHKGYV